MDIVERLLSRIKVNAAGCFEWQWNRNKDGYGTLSFHNRKSTAHRVSYQTFRGDIPAGVFVCHHCDNPSCINPAHLFLGTALDNKRDCVKKSRHSHGTKVNTNKLSVSDVREIRRLRSAGQTILSIANRYGITDACVSHIYSRRIWKHVS